MNNKEIIEKELIASIKQIKEVCEKNKIPVFMALPLSDTGSTTTYYSECLSPAVLDIPLAEDKITKMLNVMNGFDTVAPMEIVEVYL